MTEALLHATCIALDGRGVLLMGEPGRGKSDLALRLIDSGASLVADDQVSLSARDALLYASAPAKIAGLLEMRGVGIRRIEHLSNVPLVLAVRLVPREEVERLPEPAFFSCLDCQVPLVSLHAFDSSTESKIRHLLRG